MLRSRLGWFVKGLPHAGAFREAIKSIAAEDEALAAIETFCATLEKKTILEFKIDTTDGEDVTTTEDPIMTRQLAITSLQNR
jgi:hypothetical protein